MISCKIPRRSCELYEPDEVFDCQRLKALNGHDEVADAEPGVVGGAIDVDISDFQAVRRRHDGCPEM